MDELDFSALSDDQIVELAIALAREAMRRNPALNAAFAQAVVDERARVEALAAGAERAKAEALRDIRQQAERAEREVQRERLRKRQFHAMGSYLKQVAAIVNRPAKDLTLVWKPRDVRGSGPQLQLNLGVTGEETSWHLIDYVEVSQQMHTSPALHPRKSELLSWAREVCAAIRALGNSQTIVVKGIEL